jgi:hypothetical protein
VQEVPGSNPGGPTKEVKELQTRDRREASFGVQLESKVTISVVGTGPQVRSHVFVAAAYIPRL